MNYRGYSRKFIEANRKADYMHIGVHLGRICIKRDIPIADVADYLGVSRQSVYNWFLGANNPHPRQRVKLEELATRLKENDNPSN